MTGFPAEARLQGREGVSESVVRVTRVGESKLLAVDVCSGVGVAEISLVARSAAAGEAALVAVRLADIVSYRKVGLGYLLRSDEVGMLHPTKIVKKTNRMGAEECLVISPFLSVSILHQFGFLCSGLFPKGFLRLISDN